MPQALDATVSAYPRDLLAQARLQSSDERLLNCLERLACDSPDTFTRRLGLTLHYPVLDSHSLLASTPASTRWPWPSA